MQSLSNLLKRLHTLHTGSTFAKNWAMTKDIHLLVVGSLILIGGVMLEQRANTRKYKSLYEQSLQDAEIYEQSIEGLEEEVNEYRGKVQRLSEENDTLNARLYRALEHSKKQ